jgi:hypothetical protein
MAQQGQPDAIDQFIALPKEERGKLFEQLAPEKQQSLLAEIKKRRDAKATAPVAAPPDPSGRTPTGEPSANDDRNGFQRWADNLITPDPRREEWQSPAKNTADDFARHVAANFLPIISHPIDSAVGFAKQVGGAIANGWQQPGGVAAEFVRPMIEGVVNDYMQYGPVRGTTDALGTVLGMWATGEIGGEATRVANKKVIGPLTGSLKDVSAKFREAGRKGAQTVLGGGERQVATEVGNAATRQKTADTAHQEQSFGAVQDTKGRELQYQQDVRVAERDAALANKAVEEHNRAKLKEHDASLDAAAKQNLKNHIQYLSDEAEIAKQNAIKSQEVVNKNRAEHQRYETELAEAQRKNTAAHVQHQAETAEAENANAAARAIPDSRAGLEKSIKDTTEKADVLTERARHDALKEGNEKYNGVNHALDHIEADPETTKSILLNAVESLSDQRGKMPPLIKDLDDRLNGRTPGGDQRGPMNYDELQGFYSKLGNALSGRSLEGEAYHAYDITHDAIGKEMQRIADSKGMGQELTAAREFWRRMKQTFGKSSDTINDRAGKAVNDASPEYTDAQREEYRNRLLGSFNPEIPKLLEAAKSAQARLDALPGDSTRPTAKTPKAPEEITVKPPKIEKAPEPTPGPTRPEEVQAKGLGELKDPVPTNYPKQPERVPIDDPPAQEEVNTRQLRENLIREKLATWTNVTRFQMTRLVAGPLGTLVAAVTGHPGLEAAGAVYTAGELSPFVLQKMMDRPGFREWITRPPADELETLKKIPDADRIKIYDGLNKAVQQAQKQGIKVDPRLAALVGAGTAAVVGPRTKELQKLRQSQ